MTRGFDYCFQATLSLHYFNACARNWTRESITPQSSFSASRTPKTRKTFSLASRIFLKGVLIEVFLCCQAECSPIRDRECSDPKGATGTLLSRRIRWNGRHRACENEEEGRLCAGPHNAGKESPHQRLDQTISLPSKEINIIAFQICLGKVRDQGKKRKTLKAFAMGHPNCYNHHHHQCRCHHRHEDDNKVGVVLGRAGSTTEFIVGPTKGVQGHFIGAHHHLNQRCHCHCLGL